MKRIPRESFKHDFFPVNFIFTPESEAKAPGVPQTGTTASLNERGTEMKSNLERMKNLVTYRNLCDSV